MDIFAARFILHVKEDDDTALSRQGCLGLLATEQRRAGMKLRLSQRVMRLWHKGAPPRQAEALPLGVAHALVTVCARVLGLRKCARHVLFAFSGCLRIGECISLAALRCGASDIGVVQLAAVRPHLARDKDEF